MVVHRYRQITLRVILPDHVLIQESLDIFRFRQIFLLQTKRSFLTSCLLLYDLIRLPAQSSQIQPEIPLISKLTSRLLLPQNVHVSPVVLAIVSYCCFCYLRVKTSSIMPYFFASSAVIQKSRSPSRSISS